MPMVKEILRPDRIRTVPDNFGWVDRRFRADGYFAALPHDALLLYFFLVAVADRNGVSFYSERTISRILRYDVATIKQARHDLVASDLIAYRHPFYQVLALPPSSQAPQAPLAGAIAPSPLRRGPDSLGAILKAALERAS